MKKLIINIANRNNKNECEVYKMKCHICNSEDIIEVYKLKNKVYCCKKCGLYFCNDAKLNTTFISDIDEKHREIGIKQLRKSNFNVICKELKNCLPKEAVGLEVGSAYSWFLEEINEELDGVCYGIEPEETVVPNFEGEKYKVFIGLFPQDLPRNIEKFDYIIFNDVFEHLPNCNSMMDECHNLLKDDGYLIINIPLSNGLFYRLAKAFYKMGRNKELNRLWQFNFHSPHLYYFNEYNIEILANKHNFKLEKVFSLDTLDSNTIIDRLCTDKQEKFAYLKALILKMGMPIIKRSKPDTGVFIFKK